MRYLVLLDRFHWREAKNCRAVISKASKDRCILTFSLKEALEKHRKYQCQCILFDRSFLTGRPCDFFEPFDRLSPIWGVVLRDPGDCLRLSGGAEADWIIREMAYPVTEEGVRDVADRIARRGGGVRPKAQSTRRRGIGDMLSNGQKIAAITWAARQNGMESYGTFSKQLSEAQTLEIYAQYEALFLERQKREQEEQSRRKSEKTAKQKKKKRPVAACIGPEDDFTDGFADGFDRIIAG